MTSSWLDIKKTIQTAPKEPGVYIFYGSTGSPQAARRVLYVGKATNLRARLKSYLKITDYKTGALQNESTSLEPIVLRSDIEALIEESRLIKELKPRYNVLQRDDKTYSYVAFTKEQFPKVFATHKNLKPQLLRATKLRKPTLIGPFTDSGSLRTALNTIRRYFPYCTCLHPHLRDCLNAQIGKCLGFCCKRDTNIQIHTNDTNQYRKNIRAIKAILRGQRKKLFKTLTNEAEKNALEKIFEHKPFLGVIEKSASSEHLGGGLARSSKPPREKKTSPLEAGYSGSEKQLLDGSRVECFDNSHLTGREAVGALTALVKINGAWQSDKNSYRKFKIKSADTQDDPRMMAEVVERRLRHPEWRYPELMIIDGGITQYRAAKSVFEKLAGEFPEIQKIKLISMAKPQKLVYGLAENNEPTSIERLDKEFRQVIEHAIYQTHHFVIRYHRNVRNREFLPKK